MAGSAVIVGAGVFGAALADRLAGTGWDVALVEAVAPGWVGAGSGGESRLIRCAHGADEWHATSARRARTLWNDLDPSLIAEAGVAWFARRADGWEAQSEVVLRRLDIPVERLTAWDAGSLFPSLRVDDLEFVLFEPEAGVLHARRATQALVARARSRGATLIGSRARPDGAGVRLEDGRVLTADRVVWACGAWMPSLFGDLVSLRVTQQDVFFFQATADWCTPGVPGWVDYDGAAYGVGDLDGRGVKVAPDVEGPPARLDEDRVVLPEHYAAARAYLEHRFPALAGAPLCGTRVCQYEITPDTRFLAAPHPDHEGRVWLLGGGSGHAFKHGPAFAEHVEAWLDGSVAPDARFALGLRDADGALRTAGGPTPA